MRQKIEFFDDKKLVVKFDCLEEDYLTVTFEKTGDDWKVNFQFSAFLDEAGDVLELITPIIQRYKRNLLNGFDILGHEVE